MENIMQTYKDAGVDIEIVDVTKSSIDDNEEE